MGAPLDVAKPQRQESKCQIKSSLGELEAWASSLMSSPTPATSAPSLLGSKAPGSGAKSATPQVIYPAGVEASGNARPDDGRVDDAVHTQRAPPPQVNYPSNHRAEQQQQDWAAAEPRAAGEEEEEREFVRIADGGDALEILSHLPPPEELPPGARRDSQKSPMTSQRDLLTCSPQRCCRRWRI